MLKGSNAFGEERELGIGRRSDLIRSRPKVDVTRCKTDLRECPPLTLGGVGFMNYHIDIAADEAGPEKRLSKSQWEGANVGAGGLATTSGRAIDSSIVLIESHTFMRDCIHRSLRAVFSAPVFSYSTFSEFEQHSSGAVSLFLLSLSDIDPQGCKSILKALSELAPNAPIVVLADSKHSDWARTAIRNGAKGYIPDTTNFEIAVEAVRFILAGGTYVPIDYLLLPEPPVAPAPQMLQRRNPLTASEIRVVRALQEGKPNKVIAYELNICESTVKVHLRNVMKKLKAKNRTEVAVRTRADFALDIHGLEMGVPSTTLAF